MISHYLEMEQNNSDFLFSTDALFVLYLNDAFKVRYGLHKLAERHLIDQFFVHLMI